MLRVGLETVRQMDRGGRSQRIIPSILRRLTHVSCCGYEVSLKARVMRSKVAPRIIVLFVLDREYISVKDVFVLEEKYYAV